MVFDLIDNNKEFATCDFGQDKKSRVDVLDMFPKLNNFYRHFAGHPKIARWALFHCTLSWATSPFAIRPCKVLEIKVLEA